MIYPDQISPMVLQDGNWIPLYKLNPCSHYTRHEVLRMTEEQLEVVADHLEYCSTRNI